MADEEKTEKATPKRRKEAREEGRNAKSQDLAAGITLLTLFGTLKISGGYIVRTLEGALSKYLSMFGEYSQNTAEVSFLHLKIVEGFAYIAMAVAPVLLCAVLIGFAVEYAQVGNVKKKDPMTPKLDKLNPVNGIKNMFSTRAVVELIKSIVKFAVMAYVLYTEIRKRMSDFPTFILADYRDVILFMKDIIFSVGFKLGGIMLAIGVFDFIYQKWSFEKSIRMSKQEIKDEFKQTEGDPKIKSRIKQKQREISMRRMMAAVPGADVVITNPTHYAVALKYDDNGEGAPVVVAKGKDFVARKIKEKAKEHRIEMVENRPLAQALYKAVPVGVQIPPEFYRAVAEILAQIYKKKRRKIKR